jgi:hypothetical protein
MIRHELVTSILRFYAYDSNDLFEPYGAVCTLLWESTSVVWIQGFHGKVSRSQLRELMNFCEKNKIQRIKAHRSPGHRIPFMEEVGDHLELDVNRVLTIFRARKVGWDTPKELVLHDLPPGIVIPTLKPQ